MTWPNRRHVLLQVCDWGIEEHSTNDQGRTTIEASSVDVDVDFVVDVELIVELVAVNVRKAEREKESKLWRLG